MIRGKKLYSAPGPFLSLFKPPLRDIFALRAERFADNYHSVTIKNIIVKLSDVDSIR